MRTLTVKHRAARPLKGKRKAGIVGVVASGNCEALFERALADHSCEVEIRTPVTGYDEVWKMVVAGFVERCSPGGMRVSINDGGATPDVVTLRLMQGSALMEGE